VLIVDSRDLRDRRAATVRRVFGFIGVDDSWIPPTIDQEFLRSDGRRVKPLLLRALRRIPRVRTMSVYVPDPIKRSKKAVTGRLRPGDELRTGRADMSDALRARLSDTLHEDVVRFRDRMGASFDGWGIG
jgi:hypothetical protein